MKAKIFTQVALGAILISGTAAAETITTTTKTYVQPQEVENVRPIDFTVFDVNNDGVYTMAEVGERLFESFDRNNDDLIDNLEWDEKTVLTITPMEKETYKFVDVYSDGMVEESVYTYQTFYQASGLAEFDKNNDGLSAEEFVDAQIQEMDDNEDNLINLDEWQDAYMASRPEHNQPENYNP
jgi:hypothetical protein